MPTRFLPTAEWEPYFDRISKLIARQLPSARVELSVDGLDLGHQSISAKALLEGITHDPADDLLTFFLEGLEHNIVGPREVWLDEGPDGLHSIAVVDAEGHKQIAIFHELLPLPSA
jgi:hypothetical protein